MATEQNSLDEAIARLREKFQAHCTVGQDQFFGLRRKIVRKEHSRSSRRSAIEWYNALGQHRSIGSDRGRLIEVAPGEEDEAFMALHAELAKLRAARPRVLPRPAQAPEKIIARGATG